MVPLTITFRQAHEEGACPGSYRKMARHVGGIRRYGADTPLPIATVLDVLGLEDALWALDVAGYRRALRLWACDCAERVLSIFERAYPGDRRPREALRVSQLWARGLATEAALAAARDAAWAAELDATERAPAWSAASSAAWAASLEDISWGTARDVARDAACAAAWAASGAASDAERAWQIVRLSAYLRGEA